MRRRLFTIASAVSLLLCVATVVLWVRSYWRNDFVGRVGVDGRARTLSMQMVRSSYGVVSVQAQLDMYADRIRFDDRIARLKWRLALDSKPSRRGSLGYGFWNRFGFSRVRYGSSVQSVRQIGEIVSFPHWLLCAVLAIIPVVRTGAAVRHRYRSNEPGRCRNCFYDLTGNTSGVCPECGTAVKGST